MWIGGWQELGGGGNGQKLVHGFKVLFWGVRNVLELDVTAVWNCQGTQCHGVVRFQVVLCSMNC